MKILLSKESKKELLQSMKDRNNSKSLFDLAKKLGVSKNTLDNWFYNPKRYIPGGIIPSELLKKLKIVDKQEDNWGKVKGGKKTYKVILKKYGINEIKRRQSLGGKKSVLQKRKKEEEFELDINHPLFLEFYGILLGDGWIGEYSFKNKKIRLIGISGHYTLDRDFFMYCKKNIKQLFNRKAYFKEKPKTNSIELQISHGGLFNFLSKQLNFPIGKKGVGLKIHEDLIALGFDKLKYIIRGIFDTDGCFYLDKTPAGLPYPCISIKMKAPILIRQLHDILKKQGFKLIYKEYSKDKGGQSRITLKGRKQISQWMNYIGSSNLRHLNKMNKLSWCNLDSTTAS